MDQIWTVSINKQTSIKKTRRSQDNLLEEYGIKSPPFQTNATQHAKKSDILMVMNSLWS